MHSKIRRRCGCRQAVLAAVLLYACAAQAVLAAAAAPADEPVDDMTRLERGEVLVETIQEDEPGGAVRVTGLFHAQPMAIWKVIGYCRYAFVYLKGLKLCQVLKPGLYETRMRQRIKHSWYTPALDFTIDASRSADRTAKFSLVDGNLKVLEGRWRLAQQPGDEGIIVSYALRIQPDFPSPKWLLQRSLRHDLPDMLACIRGLAGASGDDARTGSDLKRCPGDVKSVRAAK